MRTLLQTSPDKLMQIFLAAPITLIAPGTNTPPIKSNFPDSKRKMVLSSAVWLMYLLSVYYFLKIVSPLTLEALANKDGRADEIEPGKENHAQNSATNPETYKKMHEKLEHTLSVASDNDHTLFQKRLHASAVIARSKKGKIGKHKHGGSEKLAKATATVSKLTLYSWKYLFQGQSLCLDQLPRDVTPYYTPQGQLIFAVWDPSLDTSRGDIAVLQSTFATLTSNGLNILRGDISINGHKTKVYELRNKCETRILGVTVQEPGEIPVIFFTLPCNHKGIERNKALAVKQAQERYQASTAQMVAPSSTQRLKP